MSCHTSNGTVWWCSKAMMEITPNKIGLLDRIEQKKKQERAKRKLAKSKETV